MTAIPAARVGRRVAITGLGVVSALGSSVADVAGALRRGESGIGPLGNAFADLRDVLAGQVRGYSSAAHFDRSGLRTLDRLSQIAVVASRQAVLDSGLAFRGELAARTAVVLGSTTGGQETVDEANVRLYRDHGRVPPLTISKWMVNAPAAHVSMEHGITGPSFCVASACASATHALGLAFQMVRGGAAEVALTGGADASLTYGAVKCWEAMRIMAPDACRPFTQGRRGMVLGEGSAIFVLEPLAPARARGATIYAEVLGFGASSDAASIAAPNVEGQAAAILRCLEDARLDPTEIDYVNAHGTGTMANDITETAAIRLALGRQADRLAVSSTKAMHGHALGAAGAIELLASVIALLQGFIPPTINFGEPDPQCDLDYVPNVARDQKVGALLSNSFAFGGHNAVLAVGRGG